MLVVLPRNILLAGTPEAAVKRLATYIGNETAVRRAKMFPFQYFTAFDMLTDLKEMKAGRKERKKPRPGEEKRERWMVVKEEKQAALAKAINTSHLDLLRKALDTAVNIAARSNVPPLPVSSEALSVYSTTLSFRAPPSSCAPTAATSPAGSVRARASPSAAPPCGTPRCSSL
jgi:hypothetical protein